MVERILQARLRKIGVKQEPYAPHHFMRRMQDELKKLR